MGDQNQEPEIQPKLSYQPVVDPLPESVQILSPPPPINQKVDILGILSIVFDWLFFPLGIVLGILGMKKAKKENRKNTVSKIGLILGIIELIAAIAMIGVLVLAISGSSNSHVFF